MRAAWARRKAKAARLAGTASPEPVAADAGPELAPEREGLAALVITPPPRGRRRQGPEPPAPQPDVPSLFDTLILDQLRAVDLRLGHLSTVLEALGGELRAVNAKLPRLDDGLMQELRAHAARRLGELEHSRADLLRAFPDLIPRIDSHSGGT